MHAAQIARRAHALFALGVTWLAMTALPLHAQTDAPAAAAPALAQHDSAPPAAEPRGAYWNDPKFMQAWNDGLTAKLHREYSFALDSFKKADKLSGDGCLKCLDQIYELQVGLERYKDAIATADRMQAVAVTPVMKSLALARRGQALLKQGGDRPKPEQLAAADTALKAALAIYPRNTTAEWFEGCTLARMGKDAEASAAFNTCATLASPKDPMRVRAQHFAADPKLSMAKMAPAFAVTTLDGTHFNLDQMQGRVVLIDFWATWCGPCNEELPEVQRMARVFAGEPLVILSVSWDADEQKWKDFIEKNHMTWQQYRDADHTLSQRFGVNAIPHYFTIDSDGVLTAEILGGGHDVEGRLRKLIKKAKDAKPAAAPTTVASGTD